MTKWSIILLTVLASCGQKRNVDGGQRKDDDSTTNNYLESNTIKLTSNDKQILHDFKIRMLSFDNYLKGEKTKKYFTCPSCGFPTLTETASYDICTICDWEDDGQDDSNADENLGGPNKISLTESRLKIGSELKLMVDSTNGKVVSDPLQFFNILSEHEKRMKTAEEKINDDADTNDPAWENWRRTRELIKSELVKGM